MANVPLSISTVNFTNYFIAVLVYNDDPLAEVARIVISPGDLSGTNNVVFTDVIPKGAEVRYYESADGTSLTTLKGRFQIMINEKINIEELRYYTVGGTQVDENDVLVDPEPGSRELTDSYFDGKVVASIFREGYRDLKEWKDGAPFDGNEWRRVDNTLQLLNPENGLMDGPIFNAEQVYVVKITYLQDQIIMGSGNPPVSYVDITASVTLTSANRRRVNVIEVAASKQVITAEPLASMLEGDWYEFDNNNSAHQVLFKCASLDYMRFNGANKSQWVIGVGEKFKVAKKGSTFEILHCDPARRMVGQFFKSYQTSEIGALFADGVDRDGDVYPGAWEHVINLPSTVAIHDDQITEGKEACWYWWTVTVGPVTTKHFRTPNKQGAFSRNLKSFSVRGSDTTRVTTISGGGTLTNDNPAGEQEGKTGEHRHLVVIPSGITDPQFPFNRGDAPTANNSIRKHWYKNGGGAEGYELDTAESEPSAARTSKTGEGISSDGYPTNIGEYEFVRI